MFLLSSRKCVMVSQSHSAFSASNDDWAHRQHFGLISLQLPLRLVHILKSDVSFFHARPKNSSTYTHFNLFMLEFSPQSTAELTDAISACITQSPHGDCQNSLHGPIGQWDVSGATNMYQLFSQMKHFDQDISNWNVSRVTNMAYMFFWAQSFKGYDLRRWNVARVTNMVGMFFKALSFDSDISMWDVSHVTDMARMFLGTNHFNSDISKWKVSSVTSMAYMFTWATSFNVDLSDWNVSQVTSMDRMFFGAESFDRTLSGCAWVHSKAHRIGIFLYSHGSIATTNANCGDLTALTTLTTPVIPLSSTQMTTPGTVISIVPSTSTVASMTKIATMTTTTPAITVGTTAITRIAPPNPIVFFFGFASTAMVIAVIIILVMLYKRWRGESSLNTQLIVDVKLATPVNAFPPRDETNPTGKQAYVTSKVERRGGRIVVQVSLPSQINAIQSGCCNVCFGFL